CASTGVPEAAAPHPHRVVHALCCRAGTASDRFEIRPDSGWRTGSCGNAERLGNGCAGGAVRLAGFSWPALVSQLRDVAGAQPPDRYLSVYWRRTDLPGSDDDAHCRLLSLRPIRHIPYHLRNPIAVEGITGSQLRESVAGDSFDQGPWHRTGPEQHIVSRLHNPDVAGIRLPQMVESQL